MTDFHLNAASLDRARPLREQIYALIRQMILTAQLRPGAAVDEKAIAGQLAVSRTPVREAVKKLSDENLVAVKAQSGTRVTPLDRAGILEAHIIRRALELESAGFAAERLTAAQANRLEDIHLLHKAAIDRQQFPQAIGQDDAFHRAICEVSGFAMLWHAIDVSKAQLDRCRHLMLPQEGMAAATLADHRAILDALATGDPEAARAAMGAHLDRAYANTTRFLDTFLTSSETEPT